MVPARLEKIKNMAHARLKNLRVVLEDIHDPHNAAAILRTCDALGIQDVWYIFEQEKAYNPRQVGKSSSSSANKWLSFRVFGSTKECAVILKKEGYTNVGTVLSNADASSEGYDFPKHEAIAVWVGNEHRGLSAEALKQMDVRLKLPMRGMVESLNVSVATALFLFQISQVWRSQKRTLTPEAINTLVKELTNR